MDSKLARGLGWHLLRVGSVVLTLGVCLIGYDAYDSNQARIEAILYPVLTDWTADKWVKDEDDMWHVHVTANKRRGECVYDVNQVASALITTSLAPVGREVLVDRTTGLTRGTVRPPGVQDFGVWKIESRVLEVGDTVTFAMRHNCGSGRPVVTIIGPFTVGYTYPAGVIEQGYTSTK